MKINKMIGSCILIIFPLTIFCQSLIGEWQKLTVSIGVTELVEVKDQSGKIKKRVVYKVIGSGVIFYVKKGTDVIPTLITAKHVFEDSTAGWLPNELNIRFSWFDDKPVDEYFGISIKLKNGDKKNWFSLPDINNDLAGIPLLVPEIIAEGVNFGAQSIKIQPYSQIASNDEIFEGANIYVLGYPGAVGFEYWTRALVRKGIISWVSKTNKGTKNILIDCDIFPGNSGGPVFYVPMGLGSTNTFEVGGDIRFIGIVVQRRFSEQKIIDSREGKPIEIDSTGTQLLSLESIGIGVVEPAIKVRQLLKLIQEAVNK